MAELKELIKSYLKQQMELFPKELYFVDGVKVEIPTLANLEQKVKQCQKCKLAPTRTNVVFGMGNPNADIMFIGEAPGENEDLQGLPFVGRAGELLDRMLKDIKLDRTKVYIANIIKCRPPNNRTPHTDEVQACIPYLYEQINLIQPKLIVCLGRVAASNLLKIEYSIEQLRGKVLNFNGIKVVVTYHPAAILRNINLKPSADQDFQMIKKLYEQI